VSQIREQQESQPVLPEPQAARRAQPLAEPQQVQPQVPHPAPQVSPQRWEPVPPQQAPAQRRAAFAQREQPLPWPPLLP
jgi:hypothetical protein